MNKEEMIAKIVEAGYRKECIAPASVREEDGEIHFKTGTCFYNETLWDADQSHSIIFRERS